MKKIVINALPYKQSYSGIGVLIRELFGCFVRKDLAACRVVLPQDAPDFPNSSHTELIRVGLKQCDGVRRIWFQSVQMGRKYCQDSVLLTTDSKTPFFLPSDCDIIPLVTDLAVYRMPEVYYRSRVILWRLQYRYLKRRAHRWLAISEFTKSEMVNLLHVLPRQIEVIPCACPTGIKRLEDQDLLKAILKKHKISTPFVLFVGNNNPRKNLERMIRAFDLAKSKQKLPHVLVIAGEHGWKFDSQNALKGLHYPESVIFIGFVPAEDLSALYSSTDLFVFPTLYEGFGIPVLEAQACGAPVLASCVSALPEVGGDGALYIDPYNTEEIANGMTRILNDQDLRRDLIKKGYDNCKRFSWEDSAIKLAEILKDAAR